MSERESPRDPDIRDIDMAENRLHTSADDPADHGHHGHHILSAGLLLKVFFSLVGLTVLTVVLALMERAEVISFGGNLGSIGVALLIAGVKAALVAMYFMALKYDSKMHAVAFVMSLVFLVIFFTFTWFDTGFRGEWDGVPDGRALDIIELERIRETERDARVPELQSPATGSYQDTLLLGPPPVVQ